MFIKRLFKGFLACIFLLQAVCPGALAADLAALLPLPGAMTGPSPAFAPASIKGVRLNDAGGLRLEFVMTQGDDASSEALSKENIDRLVSYFLSAMTLKGEDMWVNLSPYEGERMIPDGFAVTAMGRDLLAQDYLLKQLTASLLFPEKETGRRFWDKVYREAQERFGVTDIPVDTFNKVWITPDRATVYENGMTAYILKSHLKVMLESDYLAEKKTLPPGSAGQADGEAADMVKQIMREVIIPAIEQEVNEGRQFATLRQIYDAQILAVWFKQALKASALVRAYADQGKVAGIDVNDPAVNQAVYDRYVEAFRKGVFNFVKEEKDPATDELIPRKYFSGGAKAWTMDDSEITHDLAEGDLPEDGVVATVDLAEADRAEEMDQADPRNAYFVDSRGRSLKDIIAFVEGRELSFPVWDKTGASFHRVKMSVRDFLLGYLARDPHLFEDQLNHDEIRFVNAIESFSNEKLSEVWAGQRSLFGGKDPRFATIQRWIDTIAFADRDMPPADDMIRAWNLIIDNVLQPLTDLQASYAGSSEAAPELAALSSNMKKMFLLVYEVFRRWYRVDHPTIHMLKDQRRFAATLAGVIFFGHGEGNAVAMDVKTSLNAPMAPVEEVADSDVIPDLIRGRAKDLQARVKVLLHEFQILEEMAAALEKDFPTERPHEVSMQFKEKFLAWMQAYDAFIQLYLRHANSFRVMLDTFMANDEILGKDGIRKKVNAFSSFLDMGVEVFTNVQKRYMPAVIANVMGEEVIRRNSKTIELNEFLLTETLKFQTKVKDSHHDPFKNETMIRVEGEKVSVDVHPDLLFVVLERQYENALAAFKEQIGAGRSVDDPGLKVVFRTEVIRLDGKRFARLTMTNPGKIPDGPGDKLDKDLMSGLPNMFLLKKNRVSFSKGGTSMPFCHLAYWNMGMKVRVENIVEDGEAKVRFTTDIPITDNASLNEDVVPARVTPPDNAGGIDLNDKNLALDVQRGGALADQAMAFDLGRISGLRPILVQVVPLQDLSAYLQKK